MTADTSLDLAAMKRMTALAGFTWSDAELETIRPAVEAMLGVLAGLETLDVGAAEPTTQYRAI